jgi:hypothetical protein
LDRIPADITKRIIIRVQGLERRRRSRYGWWRGDRSRGCRIEDKADVMLVEKRLCVDDHIVFRNVVVLYAVLVPIDRKFNERRGPLRWRRKDGSIRGDRPC